MLQGQPSRESNLTVRAKKGEANKKNGAVEETKSEIRAALESSGGEAAMELLSEIDPEIRRNDPELIALEGAALIDLDQLDEAAPLYQRLVELRPDDADPCFELARLCILAKDGESAADWARKARNRAPQEIAVSLDAIEIFERLDLRAEARAEAARALGEHKGNAELQSRLGMLAQAHGDLDLAISALAAAVVHPSPAAEAYLPLGLIFWDHVRRPEFARAAHLTKLTRHGHDPHNLRELGWIELLGGNRRTGTALLLAGIDAFDHAPSSLVIEQWAAESDGRPIEEVLAAIETPRPASIHLGTALFFIARGNFPMAERWLRDAISVDPDDAESRLDLARLLFDQYGDGEESAELLAKIDRDRLDDPELAAALQTLETRIESGSPMPAGDSVTSPAGGSEQDVLSVNARPMTVDAERSLPWRGSDELVLRVIRVLSRPARRSVLLAGEPGVGKTALINEVARRIAAGECPEPLKESRILELSPTALQTDIKYLGEWQTKITRLVDEARRAPGTIIYIPRFHHLMGAGATRAHEEDMAGALAPLLSADQLTVIADGNPEPLRRMLRSRPELARALTLVDVKEPERRQVREILLAARSWIRRNEGPRIESAAVDRVIDLSARFLRHERFPAKGIDLLRTAFETVREGSESLVTPEDVARELSLKTGLPKFLVLDSETLDLEQTRTFFRERILGQDDALSTMQDTVARMKTGLQDPQRPIATYLFTGPTGVGKTETAKVLAAYLFADEKRMLRFDMSEFSDPLAVDRLIEAREGAAGARGHLTGAVRENPLSVILFDEIEKAHPRVFDLLLQVLGEGRLTDTRGETVGFHESVIIMTSNLGSDRGTEGGLGFTRDRAAAEAAAIREEVQRFFRPEFMNRIDRVVPFRRLSLNDLRTVALREIGRCIAREGVVRRGIVVETDPSVADLVLDRGQSGRYGARELKRAVEELVAVPLARLLAGHALSTEDTVRLVSREGSVVAEVVHEVAASPGLVAKAAEAGEHRSLEAILEAIEATKARIDHLAESLGIPSAQKRAEELRREMERPGFWDDSETSTSVLRSLAEQNRLLDRDRAVRVELEEAALLADLVGEGHRELLPEADQKLAEIELKSEEMELETLLSMPGDVRSAFVILTAGDHTPDDVAWVNELACLYERWGTRRGMEAEIVGERSFRGSTRGSAVLHIDGAFAFGLLRRETGTHRRVQTRPDGERSTVVARIHVIPEPQGDPPRPNDLRYRASRSSKTKFISAPRGIVSFRVKDRRWSLRTSLESPAAEELAAAFSAGLAESDVNDDELATIARNVLLIGRRSVQDPRSEHESTDVRAVLDGEIDDFILAALAAEPTAP